MSCAFQHVDWPAVGTDGWSTDRPQSKSRPTELPFTLRGSYSLKRSLIPGHQCEDVSIGILDRLNSNNMFHLPHRQLHLRQCNKFDEVQRLSSVQPEHGRAKFLGRVHVLWHSTGKMTRRDCTIPEVIQIKLNNGSTRQRLLIRGLPRSIDIGISEDSTMTSSSTDS